MIFFFSIPTVVVVCIIIWMAIVEPLGFLATVGRFLSGLFGLIFTAFFLFGIVMTISAHLDDPEVMGLIMSYTFTLLMLGLVLVMRWAYMKLL